MPVTEFIDMESRVNIAAEGLFTDREEPRKAFWDTYKTVKPNSYEVIAYYGTGGIGKTTLLKKIASEMDERIEGGAKDHVYISFEGKPDKEYVLYMISRQLMIANKGLSCPLFDTAFIRLLTASGKSVESYENDMKRNLFDNSILQSAIGIADAVSPIPGISTATDILERVCTFVGKRRDDRERKEGRNARIYYEIDSSDPKDLRKNLHEYLRKDVEKYMSERERPAVIMLDGYENFVDVRETGTESMNLEADRWLKDPVRGLSGIPNTLWVIAGREMPHWDKAVLPENHMHRIGDLCENDTVDFFMKAGVEDEGLAHGLYELTNGTPVFMDMCVDTYRSVKKERIPAISDFGKDTSELACRYLERMSPEMRTMLFILVALPNVWDRCWAEDMAKELGREYCLHTLDDILNMSIVERVDDGYRLHKTLRDVIKKEGDFADTVQSTYEQDLVIEKGMIEEAQDQTLIQLAKRIISAPKEDYIMGDIRRFAELFRATDKRVVSDDDMYELASRIGDEIDDSGAYGEGEEILNPIAAHVKKTGYLPLTIVKYGNARNNNLRLFGKYSEALEESLKTYEYARTELGEEHPGTLSSLNNLANSYGDTGDKKKALELMEKCYEARVRVLGEEHPDTKRALSLCFLLKKAASTAATEIAVKKEPEKKILSEAELEAQKKARTEFDRITRERIENEKYNDLIEARIDEYHKPTLFGKKKKEAMQEEIKAMCTESMQQLSKLSDEMYECRYFGPERENLSLMISREKDEIRRFLNLIDTGKL